MLSEDRGKVKNMQNSVAEFMRAAGQNVADSPTVPDAETVWLRINLLQSEMNEYKEAAARCIKAQGGSGEEFEAALTELYDAQVDILYVLMGDFNTYGTDHQEGFGEVHRSNMSKVVDGAVIKRADGKILKPDTFVEPDLRGVLFG